MTFISSVLLLCDILRHLRRLSLHPHVVLHLIGRSMERSWSLAQGFKRAGLLNQRQLILNWCQLLNLFLRLIIVRQVRKVEGIVTLHQRLLNFVFTVWITSTSDWPIVTKAVWPHRVVIALHFYLTVVTPTILKYWRYKWISSVRGCCEKPHASSKYALRLDRLFIVLSMHRWLRVAKDIFHASKRIDEILLARLLSCLLQSLLLLQHFLFFTDFKQGVIFCWLKVLRPGWVSITFHHLRTLSLIFSQVSLHVNLFIFPIPLLLFFLDSLLEFRLWTGKRWVLIDWCRSSLFDPLPLHAWFFSLNRALLLVDWLSWTVYALFHQSIHTLLDWTLYAWLKWAFLPRLNRAFDSLWSFIDFLWPYRLAFTIVISFMRFFLILVKVLIITRFVLLTPPFFR